MKTNNLPRMDDRLLSQVRTMIKKKCCNFQDGNCIILDWEFCAACPQYTSYSLNCKWFRNCILPANPELEATILQDAHEQCEYWLLRKERN